MNENLTYTNCYVAYLDILGFKDAVYNTLESDETLSKLIKSLEICKILQGNSKDTSNGYIDVQTRFFSDSIVYFIRKDITNLSQLFFMIRFLQDNLWENGYCLRGAITKGEMYWPNDETDKIITVGPSFVDAYKLESENAIYPRILISKQLFNDITKQPQAAKPFAINGTLINYIHTDCDGMHFLDLLNSSITRTVDEELKNDNGTFSIHFNYESESNYSNIVTYINSIIAKNFKKDNIKIRQKFEWLSNYLNSSLSS